jgi:hypothetical protein
MPLAEESISDERSQGPLQTSAELVRACEVHTHDLLNAIAAATINAEVALNWLHARPPSAERVERALNRIVSDGKRAGEIVNRLRAEVVKASRQLGTTPFPVETIAATDRG